MQDDKENISLQSPLPSRVGSAAKLSVLRFQAPRGKSFSPNTAKQILLQELGPSPSRESLATFVAQLTPQERKRFLGEDMRTPAAQRGGQRAGDTSPTPGTLYSSPGVGSFNVEGGDSGRKGLFSITTPFRAPLSMHRSPRYQHIHPCTNAQYTFTRTHARTHTHTYTHTHTHIITHTYIHTRTYSRTHKHTYTHRHAHTHTHIHTTCMHTHTHTHTRAAMFRCFATWFTVYLAILPA